MNCPRCGHLLMKGNANGNLRYRKSLDHILPKERGGNKTYKKLSIQNIEIICNECNNLRENCGHCWAALACVRTVAADTKQNEWQIMRAWGIGQVRRQMYEETAIQKGLISKLHSAK